MSLLVRCGRSDGTLSEKVTDVQTETLLRITARRAAVLREMADGYTEREAARRLGISLTGLRSHLEELRNLTGLDSGRELGRWWRQERTVWLHVMSLQAGAPVLTSSAAER